MSPAFDHDREAVIARAQAAGVKTLIITGSSIESSVAAAAYARNNTNCMTTAGVHPHNAKDWDAAASDRLRELAAGGIAALGECGLDYNRNFYPPQAQRKCFEDQLALAAQLGRPVFLHERDAFAAFHSILKQYRANLPGAVVHCFTGGQAELEAYLELDCYIGITGWICDERRGAHLSSLLPHIPADRLLLETDAPYLLPRNLPSAAPRSLRGKSGRNEPCFLPHIAAYTAEILDKPPDQLANETSANARRLFGIPAAKIPVDKIERDSNN
jgi:TatD DNase family protein